MLLFCAVHVFVLLSYIVKERNMKSGLWASAFSPEHFSETCRCVSSAALGNCARLLIGNVLFVNSALARAVVAFQLVFDNLLSQSYFPY